MRAGSAFVAGLLLASAALADPIPVPRPVLPAAPAAAVAAPLPVPRPASRRVAALCGDPRLEGRTLAPIVGPGGCGVAAPVRLRAAAGVALSPPADIDCDAARALADWIEKGVKPAARRHAGAGVTQIAVAASYACRRVNNRPSGRLSQHAKGNAIDVSGFTLADGRTVTLARGWDGGDAELLRSLWRSACGPFGTVLGPDADRWHQDHFHFDTAQYRSGPYCR